MTENQTPTPGLVWEHHSGRLYKVLFLTNTAGDGIKYPHTVVYEGYHNTPAVAQAVSSPLSDWHRLMTYVGEASPAEAG